MTATAFLLCWASVALSTSLYAAEPARLPFYEAQKGDVRLYVLGTLHVGKAGEPLRQEIAQALFRSSQLVMELSFDDLPKMAPLMAARMCQDACLRKQISSETFTKLEARIPEMKIGMERIPAWMISSLLVIADYAKAGFSPELGTEIRLMKIWGNRPTRGLETPEEQVEALASMNDSAQRESLESYLALPEEKRLSLFRELHQTWRGGDAEALYAWYQKMNKEQKLSPNAVKEFDEKMILSRNQRLVERLKPFFAADKPVFVAVGALHLGGDQGILALLRAQGFSITAR
ncbi:MAG: TraB/GumN family protein [Proteobacteria bacterium]|nr:TraB/GumN family protein [Pseudomonadota bacterium]MCL2307108.1 TraB/GumN family protein [Pseudomonadota bacterium]